MVMTTKVMKWEGEKKTNMVIKESVEGSLGNDENNTALVVEHGDTLHAGLEDCSRAREVRTAVHRAERVSSRKICKQTHKQSENITKQTNPVGK